MSRFVIGSKNKQYGLIVRKKKKPKQKMGVSSFSLSKGSKKRAAPTAAPLLSVFSAAAEEDDNGPVDTKELARRYKKARQEKVGC